MAAERPGGATLGFERAQLAAPLERYAPGAVVYVAMRDFVTYEQCAAYPGPALNLVIGPNGTGKSTIVAALALCLGWGPAVLGRAPDVQAYVRAGTGEAQVVVGLACPSRVTDSAPRDTFHIGQVRTKRRATMDAVRPGSSADASDASMAEDDLAEESAETGAMSAVAAALAKIGAVPDDGIVFVSRRIGSRGSGSFAVNGVSATQLDVSALVAALGIQADNLCQFLPQDRVGQFAALSGAEKLRAVMRAAAPPHVHAQHAELVALAGQEAAVNARAASTTERLASLREQNASVSGLVERLRERDAHAAVLAQCERKRPWLEYNSQREVFLAARSAREAARSDLDAAEARTSALSGAVSSAERAIVDLQRDLGMPIAESDTFGSAENSRRVPQTAGRVVADSSPETVRGTANSRNTAQSVAGRERGKGRSQSATGDLNQRNDSRGNAASATNAEEALAREMDALRTALQEEEEVRRRALRARERVESLRAEADGARADVARLEAEAARPLPDSAGETERLTRELAALRAPLDEADAALDAAERERRDAVAASRDASRAVSELGAEFDALADARGAREEALAARAPDALRARDWLRRNRGLFAGAVYGPLALELDVCAPDAARQVEGLLGRSVLTAFVVTSYADNDVFLRHLVDEQRLRLSVAVVEDASFRGEGALDAEAMRALGFSTTLLGAISAPAPVLAFLADSVKAHLIPVSTGAVDAAGAEAALGSGRYACADGVFELRRSHYSREVAVRSVALRPCVFFGAALPGGRRAALQRRLDDARARLAGLQTRLRETLVPAAERLSARRQTLVDARASLQSRLHALLAAAAAHDAAVEAAAQARVRLGGCVDALREAEGRLDQHRADLRACAMANGALAAGVVGLLSAAYNSAFDAAGRGLLLAPAEKRLALAMAALEAGRAEEADARGRVAEAEAAFSRAKDAAKAALAAAHASNGGAELDAESRASLAALPDTLEALDEHVRQLRARVDALTLHAGGALGSQTLAHYEQRLREIAGLERALSEDAAHSASLAAEIDMREAAWRGALRDLVSSIGARFGAFLAAIGCAGCVELGEKTRAYDEWEVVVRVRFREAAELAALSAQRHSGGEKSVATMLFLLALQQAGAPAPFRLVDEINQGMDAANERAVHELLVRLAHDRAPQYFVVTPKLLPDLRYTPAMTVLCVYSGEGVPAPV